MRRNMTVEKIRPQLSCDFHLVEGVKWWTKTYGQVSVMPRLVQDPFEKCNSGSDCDNRATWNLS